MIFLCLLPNLEKKMLEEEEALIVPMCEQKQLGG